MRRRWGRYYAHKDIKTPAVALAPRRKPKPPPRLPPPPPKELTPEQKVAAAAAVAARMWDRMEEIRGDEGEDAVRMSCPCCDSTVEVRAGVGNAPPHLKRSAAVSILTRRQLGLWMCAAPESPADRV